MADFTLNMQLQGPKSLALAHERALRLAAIELEHVAPLSAYVRALRKEMGPEYSIPDFDPMDGGVKADCLFLLEAPGPKAKVSGFVSRDNPDETAKNFYLLNQEAGIDRKRTVVWNIVPWYVGSATKIRAVNAQDLKSAKPELDQLAKLLPGLHSVVLVGNKASSAIESVRRSLPIAKIYCIHHPSPMFVNRASGNRERILEALRQVARALPSPPSAT